MANYPINPFGQGGELPSAFPIVNNLADGGVYSALSAQMGKKLSAMTHKNKVFVVASDASDSDKLAADYQCAGVNDEVAIQSAVNEIYNRGGGTVLLSAGTFKIGAFPNSVNDEDGNGTKVAILIPSDNTSGYEIRIIGDTMPYRDESGTRIVVSDACYESLDSSKQYKIFSSTYSSTLANKARISLMMMNFGIYLPWNQKKIMCINLRSVNRVYLQFIRCCGYRAGYNGYVVDTTNPPAVAVEGCVGIRMTSGSNFGQCDDYKNILCSGFYEGFQVGGEHVVGINLSGVFNYYSFTFGNYPWTEAAHHPITLINCCDERTVNFPLFAYCGANRGNGNGGQEISLINFNMERYAPHTPGGQLGEYATEINAGTFHGEISYTIQQGGTNITNMPFWKNGHGQRFITRNSAQRRACGTSVRNGYAPNYLQRIWDTDLGKEVICTDTANKVWRDTMGTIV